jgi:hypothetical protein
LDEKALEIESCVAVNDSDIMADAGDEEAEVGI